MKSILLLLLLFISSISFSQDEETPETAVRAVIDQLFEGMRSGDSSLVREVFHTDAKLYTTYKWEDGFELSGGSINDFVEAVGSPHDKIWDERISNVTIRVDDALSQVWMDYSFYLGEEFSHEGVNSIILVNLDGRWQMLHLCDTRRKN